MRSPTQPPQTDHAPTISRREVTIWKFLGVAGLVALVLASVSYTRALLAPGYATWNDKTSSWVRDHGGAPLLNAYENWRYASPPPDIPPDPSHLSSPTAIPGGTATSIGILPALPTVTGSTAPTWTPGRADSSGQPVAYTSVYQPDPAHRSALAGVAVLSSSSTVTHLVAGTTQPQSSGSGAGGSAIPSSEVPGLVAAFNSGWKMKDITGGFYADGTVVRDLQNGQASAVIDDTGHPSVLEWSTGDTVPQHIAAVRQNLALVVERGSIAPAIASNTDLRWGSPKNQLQYTERSGLGVDARGNLIYVAADKVNLPTLAQALLDAGAVTGMELDIHGGMTAFNSWTVDATGRLGPSALLPTVQRTPDRYLAPDRRDFFYITLASTPPNPSRQPTTSDTPGTEQISLHTSAASTTR